MSQELLSICIPTYNRSRLLRQILEVLGAQIRAAGAENVVIYISDNASPDDTPQVVGEFQKQSGVRVVYSRNDSNIGLSKNLLKVMAMGQGRFVWPLGDDEIIVKDAVPNLVKVLRERDPGFVLMTRVIHGRCPSRVCMPTIKLLRASASGLTMRTRWPSRHCCRATSIARNTLMQSLARRTLILGFPICSASCARC
jgi:glycosyltransferase involved in cell wall biosynthesis